MEDFAENVSKWVMWCYNFHEPQKFLSYISEHGGCNYKHLMEKWDATCVRVGFKAVMNYFYCELDIKNKKLLVEYVYKFYEG